MSPEIEAFRLDVHRAYPIRVLAMGSKAFHADQPVVSGRFELLRS